MKGFLYGQTEYNLLNNSIHLNDYISMAKNNEFTFLSITDKNLYGSYKFYIECKKNNIKPIIGLELRYKDDDNYPKFKYDSPFAVGIIRPRTAYHAPLKVVDLDDAKGFVIADIPGLIEGASEGVGLGHEFLRHIERTKLIIHVVDAASTEGRDPIADIYAINKELEAYNEEIAKRPQVIAANKIDAIYEDGEENPIDKIKAEFEPKGIKVFPISAVSGNGLQELLYYVSGLLSEMDDTPIVFEQEFFPDFSNLISNEPYTVEYDEEEEEYVVEGPRIEKMLGYTNLESEKGFAFFQNFLKENGILEKLEELGIQEGDTVRMYGLSFDYYK